MSRQLGIAVIGAGLQANRRLQSFEPYIDARPVCLVGRRKKPTQELADSYGIGFTLDWEKTLKRKDVDAVMICTPPDTHLEIAGEAMKAGKHVLCEKPLALSVEEAEKMVGLAKRNSIVLKCGFNHRYHPAIKQLKEWIDNGKLGKIYFARARYGHGGRSQYEQNWRSQKERAGGGQLMEHGIHVLDLFRMTMGDFSTAVGFVTTNYWPIFPLEDNAFALLRNSKGQVASLHSSLTQWRNLFSFEVGGENGIGSVEGLGGSYGVERAILNPREFDKPFKEHITEFRGVDKSWALELRDFVKAIRRESEPQGTGEDGVEAFKMVSAIYESAKRSRPVNIDSIRHK
jgi:predicted dehydrogenase